MASFGFNISTSKDHPSKQYSLTRAIQAVMRCERLDGLEGELSQEGPRELLSYTARGEGGFWAPLEAFAPATYKRDLNTQTASSGGNFVQGDVSPNVIELLRNKLVTARLGVKQVMGLKGSGLLPRATGSTTAYFVTEQGTLTKTTPTVDTVTVSPKRVGATSTYTKELLLMSPVAVDAWLKDELFTTVATKLDYTVLQGTGANTPTGILHTTGIGSVTFGAAATWDKVTDFENAVGTGNADVVGGSFGWLTTSAVRKKWRNIARVPTTNTAGLLWEGAGDNSADGKVADYTAVASAQMDSNFVAFGNWADSELLYWGNGVEVIVNPFSGDQEATVRVTLNAFVDVVVRHAASFVWSTDAGNQ